MCEACESLSPESRAKMKELWLELSLRGLAASKTTIERYRGDVSLDALLQTALRVEATEAEAGMVPADASEAAAYKVMAFFDSIGGEIQQAIANIVKKYPHPLLAEYIARQN